MTAMETDGLLTRRSLHMELGDRLRDLIIEGALEPGEKVPERALCERFGVSRTPMREALKVLAAEGLVTLAPNRGAWVSELRLDDLEDVFEVLAALEGLAGCLAAERIDEAALVAIQERHAAMLRHYEARNLQGYFRTNQEIHAGILAAADNATLLAQHRQLSSQVQRVRYQVNMSENRWARAVAEHEEIMAALNLRNGARLGALLQAHLGNKLASFRKLLAEKNSAA